MEKRVLLPSVGEGRRDVRNMRFGWDRYSRNLSEWSSEEGGGGRVMETDRERRGKGFGDRQKGEGEGLWSQAERGGRRSGGGRRGERRLVLMIKESVSDRFTHSNSLPSVGRKNA